jgi:uncharacterized protein (TIGR02118 family)
MRFKGTNLIKVAFCLRRLSSLSREEFQTYWHEHHAPLVRQYGPALNIYRYVQNHTFSHPLGATAIRARGATIDEYDGVAELWWEAVDKMIAAGSTAEGRAAGRTLLADERRFVDLANSPIFYAREIEIIGSS